MIAAIAQHIWLLITLRHDLAGLPSKSFWLMFSLFFASAIVAGARWGDMGIAGGHLAFLSVLAAFVSPRVMAAIALLSMGVDMVAIPVEYLADQRDIIIFDVWQLVAMVMITLRGIGR